MENLSHDDVIAYGISRPDNLRPTATSPEAAGRPQFAGDFERSHRRLFRWLDFYARRRTQTVARLGNNFWRG